MYNVLIYMLLHFFLPKKSWSWISKQGKSLFLWDCRTTLAILVFIIASKVFDYLLVHTCFLPAFILYLLFFLS
ncbi:hypothetical protein AMTRI_Chr09g35220 [Amborella trichopoda]